MRILLIDFVCDPYSGSEEFCGWSWAKSLAENNEKDLIYVLSHEKYREHIIKGIDEWNLNNVKPLFIETPSKLLFLNNHFYLQFINYMVHEFVAIKYIKSLNLDFDVIHHVTLGDYRMLGFWSGLKPPFIFGPVGGGRRYLAI